MTDNIDKAVRDMKDFLLSEEGKQAVEGLEQSIAENPEEWQAYIEQTQRDEQVYFNCSHDWVQTNDKYTERCTRCGWSRFDADQFLADHPEKQEEYREYRL
jgi:hypothetical protein